MNLSYALGFGLTLAFLLFTTLAIFFVPGFVENLWGKSRKLGMLTIAIAAFGLLFAVTQVDLTYQVKNILPTANGGTGIAYFTAAGPTAARTYTFPDASTTVLTTNSAVTVAQGGTGAATFTAHGVMLGNGGSTMNVSAAGTSGQCFTSNGSSADPTWQACPGSLNFSDNETPSGSINGSNATFTLAHTPNPSGSLNCFLNGVQQRAGSADYTLATATMTYGTAPATGSTLDCYYRY